MWREHNNLVHSYSTGIRRQTILFPLLTAVVLSRDGPACLTLHAEDLESIFLQPNTYKMHIVTLYY